MKRKAALIFLTVASVLFVTGGFILCHCAGWFGLAAVFAIGSVWLGSRPVRIAGLVVLLLSLTATHFEFRAGQEETARFRELRRKAADGVSMQP